MKVFITGGTGFIGKTVVRELKARKHTVTLFTGRLSNTAAVRRQLRRFKPHVAIHLAWEGIPDLGADMSARNVLSSIHFLMAAAEARVPKVIVAGSSYQHKGVDPGNHRSFVVAKNAIRDLGKALIEEVGGVFIWTYPYFVYGPGKPGRSLIPSLLADARARRQPRAKDPDAWHDFVHVDDIARAFVLLAEKKVASGAFDIGSGSLTRTGDIANIIARLSHLPRTQLKKCKKNGTAAAIQTLTRATLWRPRVTIAKGIASMLNT